MPEADINYMAVVVGAVISMVLGYVWYSPVLFAKAWTKEMGKSEKELKESANATSYLIMFVASLVLAYVLAHFVDYTNSATTSAGAVTGFWLWLGFMATVGVSQTLFHGKTWKLFCIDYGYHLVEMLIIGAVLAVWA